MTRKYNNHRPQTKLRHRLFQGFVDSGIFRGRSRICVKWVHMYIGVGAGIADFYLIFHKKLIFYFVHGGHLRFMRIVGVA